MADLLLITPPFTQLNTPYPATAYLKGFLNTKGIAATQMDLGIDVILELFTHAGLTAVFDLAHESEVPLSENTARILALKTSYLRSVDQVISFLQGKQPTYARQLCTPNYLPQGSRFEQLDDLAWAFGNMGIQDKAKHLATLYLEDLSDFIKEQVDPHFGFSRYAERLGRSANSFDELHRELQGEPTYIDTLTLRILRKQMDTDQPKLVCFSVPFPGNLYSAFRCAQWIKQQYPQVKIAMGGGFANTELRSVADPRVFDYFDYITLDDGELPIEILASNVLNPSASNPDHNFLKRTFQRDAGQVVYNDFSLRKDYAQNDLGTPDYSGLRLADYISVIEIANPMHSLWSDGRWNKLTMAHGCYWGKCTFCDISLDYIQKYEPITAAILVDRMETLIEQTGERGFHFVDEAAPPVLMRAVAIEILRRNLTVTWWTNIRFEKNFTPDLCRLLKASGCIAVSGGLEVASDRLLALIDKGVTVAQVAQVTHAFTEAGILVHAYLMYGYPTQTVQETVDSLEMVRQLFEIGVLQSGFWHQFALTAHSPVGLDPDAYKIVPELQPITFANNDIAFTDTTGIDHDQFSYGLKKSLYNYMHGVGFDEPLQSWFDVRIPDTIIGDRYIENCLDLREAFAKSTSKILWIGHPPIVELFSERIDGETVSLMEMTFHSNEATVVLIFSEELGDWLLEQFERLAPNEAKPLTLRMLQTDFEQSFDEFEVFWESEEVLELRTLGLLVL